MDLGKLERIIAGDVDFDIGNSITKGFETFKVNPLMHIGFTFVILLSQFLFTHFLEDYVFVYSIFLSPPLLAGFYLIGNRISQNEFFDFPDYFKGFQYWLALIIVNLISSILTVIGIVFLIIPGIYLLVGYMFAHLFVIYGGFEFWTAMELSRRLVTKNWFKFFGLGVVLLLINIAGVLALGIGLLVSIPVSYFTIYKLFEDLTEDAVVVPNESEDYS